jgi:zinc protease
MRRATRSVVRAPWLAAVVSIPLGIFAAAGLRGQPPTETPPVQASFRLPVEELILDNGMRFLLAPRPGATTIGLAWGTRWGSGDEPREDAGVAHLVEHLLHQGSTVVSASDYARLYTEAGAVGIDARTDADWTAYFLRLPANQLELWFWLESDRLLRPTLGDVRRELLVIAEERRQRVDAVPDGPLGEELRRLLWGADHSYGAPPAGTPESLARLRARDAEELLRLRYGAEDLTAAIVGDFAPQQARELARRYFGRLPRRRGDPAPPSGGAVPPPAAAASGATSDAATEPPAVAAAGERIVDRSCACPPQARILYTTVPADHRDRAALDALAGVLAGRGGRLHRRLVLERGLADSAAAYHQAGRQGGSFTVVLEAAGSAPPAELVAAWDAELAALEGLPPDAAEMRRVRNQVTTDAWRGLREPLDLALRLLVADAQVGWRTLETWPAAVAAVTAADLQRVAREYLQPGRRVVARVTREAREPAP